MPVNIIAPGETRDYGEEQEGLYDVAMLFEPQAEEKNPGEAPIYQKMDQRMKKRHSFGEFHHIARGALRCGKFNPLPVKGITSYPPATDMNLDGFHKNHETFLSRINNTPGDQRDPKQIQFLLHTVLPDLETKLSRNGMTLDILRILLRLSCIKECPLVTRYTLYIILDTLSNTSYNAGGIFADFIVQCESCLKDSILGQAQGELSTFELENAEDQGLRIFVYSRALVVLYANIVQGLIPLTPIDRNNANFNALRQKLTEMQGYFAKKDKARYAIRLVKEIVEMFSQKQAKKPFKEFLICLKQHNSAGEEKKEERNKSVEKFISKIRKSKKGFFDFHIAVFCLGSQIYEKPKNIEVLRILVDNYLKKHPACASSWSSEGEWQTGLVLSNVFENIVFHNQDRDTRTKACLCLINYLRDLTKPNSLEKLWVQESLQRCVFGPNKSLRQVILDHLEREGARKAKNQDATGEKLKERFPITRSMNYLVEWYKKQVRPGSQDFLMMSDSKGYFKTMFRGEEAAVKILVSTKDNLVREEEREPSRIHKQLVVEAYTLRRLNSKPHPNIVRVFAYDTSAQPYHLITEHLCKGSLLHFLHSCRTRPGHMPGPTALIHMVLGVMDALIYLNDQHLVHLAIMAANVLVGQDNVCKLTGFQFAREMTKQCESFLYVSNVDELAVRHAAPECFTSGQFSEKSVSWAIGIMLFEMHTYGVSPYNQYSNDEHDQIRRHVSSGGKLTKEACIRTEVSDLMQMCLQFERKNRPSLIQIKIELERIYEQLSKEDSDWPDANYPSLTNVDFDQTKDVITSMTAIEDRDQEKNLGFFGSPTSAHDIPIIRVNDGVRTIRELVFQTKEGDLDRLRKLKDNNIVEVLSLSIHDPRYIALLTEDSGRGNLLQVALAKQCRPETLVTFAAQIAQAMRYMHDNDMIHSDLRAEHVMVFPTKVKVSRLGRSKSADKRLDTIKCCMPRDAIRWSPPEVIKDGIYSQSSDVYSFGIMCFELFEALSAPEGSKPEDVTPFATIKDEQILAYLEGNNRPCRPEIMPIWFYIVVKQCLLHKPAERPPFLLIVDALTSSKPFESCLLFHWINIHQSEVDNIDIKISQQETASHVIPKEHHKSFEELHQLVAVEVFLKHTYFYKPGNVDSDLPSSRKSSDAPQDNDLYDVIDSYNTANCRIPSSSTLARLCVPGRVLRDPIQEESEGDDSSTNVYEQIPTRNSEAGGIRRPLPPTPSPPSPELKKPIEETRGSTLTRKSSKLALFASTSIIDKISVEDDVDYKEDKEWPSLPAPNQAKNNLKYDNNSVPSTWSNGEFSCKAETSSYRAHAPLDSDNSQNVNVMVGNEGAVGGLPAECSLHSVQHSGNQEQEYTSMNNNHLDAEENSWWSLASMNEQQQIAGILSSAEPLYVNTSNSTSLNNNHSRNRPSFLPRTTTKRFTDS